MSSKQGDWKLVKSLFREMRRKHKAVSDPKPKRRQAAAPKPKQSVPPGHVRYRWQVYAHDYAVPAAMFLRRNEAFAYARSAVRGPAYPVASVVDVDTGKMWHVDYVVEEAELD